MTALQTRDWRTTNLHVLIKLACSPDPHTAYTDLAWVRPVQEAVRDVRENLVSAHTRGDHALPMATVAAWRTSLGQVLTDAAVSAPERWQVWFAPGSWLESNVRLERVLAEVTDESDELSEVVLAELDVPGRLGWPAWTLPQLPAAETVG